MKQPTRMDHILSWLYDNLALLIVGVITISLSITFSYFVGFVVFVKFLIGLVVIIAAFVGLAALITSFEIWCKSFVKRCEEAQDRIWDYEREQSKKD